ncbi:MAG: glycogen/starch/alpha-glucan phosphorylase [Spirochaetales bacterium]|nr:glycogen/starch/alpha-glucan phosphorylase [Spirochaetales bacterium]
MKASERLMKLFDHPTSVDLASLEMAFMRHLEYTLGKFKNDVTGADIYQALALTIRDHLVDRWNETQELYRKNRVRRVYYLSLEFLLGRLLMTNLVNLGFRQTVDQALSNLSLKLEEIAEYEPDAGLGNGGLGRLAACFLDSMSSMDLPCSGATLRYEFGIFHQQILNGYQKEAPDSWLLRGNPWEIRRVDTYFPVYFGGYTEKFINDTGEVCTRWLPGETIIAQAYDVMFPGYNTRTVNHLRMWKSAAGEEFNLDYFNHGDYLRAVDDKFKSETVSKVLYPNDNNLNGQELRLKQEYLLVSATVQDALKTFLDEGERIENLPERVFFQLNDTHPALTVPELIRLLVDIHDVPWTHALEITRKCTAYTNHTVLPEALERWEVSVLQRLLPRHLEIIYALNHGFLEEQRQRGASNELLASLSIIGEGQVRTVRMASLALIGSSAVNGVARLHSEIIKNDIFADYYPIMPEKFQNKTNGITHRRWLLTANPELAALITKKIGPDWVLNLDLLRRLEEWAADSQFQKEWHDVKRLNKEKLGHIIQFETGIVTDPESIFDVQVKRIHEYKRQHLNILRVIRDFQQIKLNPDAEYVPRTVIFGGKAAPGYHRAKMIIKLINAVARTVNKDPDVRGRLKVVFLPNYRVSQAERIFPASDLSEQISTAGMEASGTGNMKFMLNGALTIGTLDGANIEIQEEAGAENAYIFGLTDEQVLERRRSGYNPFDIYRSNADIRHVLDAVRGSYFNRDEPGIFEDIVRSLLEGGDYYLVLADFQAYLEAQKKVQNDFKHQESWLKKSILNCARSGKFSSDRTIGEYARDIWKIDSVAQRAPRVSAHTEERLFGSATSP